MKIHGKKFQKKLFKEVKLMFGEESVTFKLTTLPMSFHFESAKLFTPPAQLQESPKKLLRDSKGKPIVKEGQFAFEDDAKPDVKSYLRIMIYSVYCSLKAADPDQVQFDIEEKYENKELDVAFIDDLFDEMYEAGFSVDHLQTLMVAVSEVNSIEDMSGASETVFFPKSGSKPKRKGKATSKS